MLAFITSEPSAIESALNSAFTDIAGDLTSVATSVAPIALGVIGLSVVVIFGIKMFKRITNKA